MDSCYSKKLHRQGKARQRCVMGVGMCLYAQLVQTKISSAKVQLYYNVIVARVFRIWGDLKIAHGHFQDLKRPNHLEMVGPFQDFGQSRDGPRAFSRFWNGPVRFRILRLPRTFLRLPKGIFTIEALYYWPLIGNHTMGIQRYHFDLLRWPILGVLSPHCLNFVHISRLQNCIYYYYSHYFLYFFCLIIVIGLVVLFIN